MLSPLDRKTVRRRIRYRIRKRIAGTPERPRLAIFRSTRHIYVQAIDDAGGRTLTSASTREATVKGQIKSGGNIAAAKIVGASIAQKLKDSGVKQVVFDRGGHAYHGRVKALAESAREAGLEF